MTINFIFVKTIKLIVLFFIFCSRLFVISWFPRLEHLDDRIVTPEQQREAKRLFKRPLFASITDNSFPECFKRLHNTMTNIFVKPQVSGTIKPRKITNFVV